MTDQHLPPLLQGGIPAGLAAILQLGMALAIGKMPPWTQIIGAIMVSALVGGGVSLALTEGMHMGSTLAGICGPATGAIPAVTWRSIAMGVAAQQIHQKLGVEVKEEAKESPPAPIEKPTEMEEK